MKSGTCWPFALAIVVFLGAASVRPTAAQPLAGGAAHGGVDALGGSDVPEGVGTLRGRVVLGVDDGGDDRAGLTVALFALTADGKSGVRRTQTGPDGRFAFENISNDPRTAYLLGVRYGEIPFSLRTTFGTGERELTTDIVVARTRTAATGVERGASELRLDRGCSGVRVTEDHSFSNPTDFVFFVPPGERGDRPPIARMPLPSGAVYFEAVGSPLEEGIELRDGEVLFWGPLHPGRQNLRFGYSLPTDGVEITRRFPAGAANVRLLTYGNGPTARGEGLQPAEPVEFENRTYSAVETGPMAEGGSLTFALDFAPFEADAVRVEMRIAKIWLELDDAALDVREEFEFVVPGDTPIESGSDAPLLCLPLPVGAEDMRFSTGAFAMGIQPDAAGGLALRGPIPAGRSGFAMTYLLRNNAGSAVFERRFPTGASLLSLFVADTGVLTETDRLHRRRPIRTASRSYIHLEAFEIEPGEEISIKLTPLTLTRPLPRFAAVGFVIGASLFAGLFLTAPLRGARRQREDEDEDETPLRATTIERAGVYAAIRDLEDDFETGKVSVEDRDTMLAELRAQAGALILAERTEPEPEPEPTTPAAAEAACGGCGAAVIPEARFCSQCGAAVTRADDAAERGG